MAGGRKFVRVLMMSLAGTYHSIIRSRPKLNNKLEALHYDPIVRQKVLYREVKKLRMR